MLAGCAQSPSAGQLLDRYLNLSDAGMHEQFDQVLSGEAKQAALQANDIMAELNLEQVGETDYFDLEQISSSKWRFCMDVSETKILDQLGNDLTPEARPTHLPMTMTLESLGSTKKITELEIRRFENC